MQTDLYHRVFALADKQAGKRQPCAVLPGIQLKAPKITPTSPPPGFAKRVDDKEQACVRRWQRSADSQNNQGGQWHAFVLCLRRSAFHLLHQRSGPLHIRKFTASPERFSLVVTSTGGAQHLLGLPHLGHMGLWRFAG